MKKLNYHQGQIISINLVFKTSLIFSFLISYAFCFEIKDYEQKIKNNYGIRSVIDKLSGRELEGVLRDFIASGRPNRLVGSSGHAQTQEYLELKLKSMNSAGVTFSKSEFVGMVDKKSLTGVNFIWEKKGLISPEEVMILTANYDTLLKDPKTGKSILKGEMPGADNNASGVAIMLSMMEILNKLNIAKTVKLVFLDFGEFDSLGAKTYSSSKEFLADKNKKLVGVISLNMLGHDSRIGDTEKKMNNMNLYAPPEDAFAKMLMKSGKDNYSTVTFTLTTPSEASKLPLDASFFKTAGVPSVTFGQNREGDLNPRYMTSNDFAETLNINTYTNVFRYITSGVLAWNYDVVK
jgi:hypothetical protein